MGLEIEMRKRLNIKMEVPSFTPPTDNFAKELEDELMKFTYDDSKVGVTASGAQTNETRSKANGEVDIMECTRPGSVDPVQVPCQDTTESSSSFGDSDCDDDDDDDALGDDASSKFRGDGESAGDSQRDMFGKRRKKLRPHWRSFIQPLMWRCKWTELQIHKFESQAKRYDRALVKLRQQKHTEVESSVAGGDGVKSIPFPRSNHHILRRKKRKRAETTNDLAAVMSNHNLFSYYENRKSGNDTAFMDKAKNLGNACQRFPMDVNTATDELLLAQLGDGDDPMEHLLHKIISREFQVGEMRNRADKLVADNADNLSYLKDLGLDETDLIALLHNSDGTSIGTITPSQSTSGHNTMTDIVMRDTGTTSHVVTADPGVVIKKESVSYADTLRKGDDVLVYTKRRRLDKNNHKGVKTEQVEMHSGPSDGSGSSSAPVKEESTQPDDQPPHKLRSLAALTLPLKINKGKRARRKSASRPPQRLSG